MSAPSSPPGSGSRLRATGFGVFAVAVLMLGLAFAAVPLYRAFCRATGYAGTPQVATAAPHKPGKRDLVVRFDANVGPGLPVSFEPETSQINLRTGTTATVYYRVRNQTDRPLAANAVFNITPDVAGGYFDKIACFCFSEQHLQPGESAEWPVVFFLDPALEADQTMNGVESLTLSYTLYPVKTGAPAVAATGSEEGRAAAPKL